MNVVAHNIVAMNGERQFNIVNKNRDKSVKKLSSGYRVNTAADDAAALSISEKMRWQIRGLDKSCTNISDGISFVQTGEGALNEVHALLGRMKELTVQAANDTNCDSDRQAIQKELDQIKEETERIFTTTTFNTIPVFARKLNYVEYVDTTHQVVASSGETYINGNHYGLIEVLNQNGGNNITTASYLADRVSFENGQQWVSSGNREPAVKTNTWKYDASGAKVNDSVLSTDFSTVNGFLNNYINTAVNSGDTVPVAGHQPITYTYNKDDNTLTGRLNGLSNLGLYDSQRNQPTVDMTVTIKLKKYGSENLFAVSSTEQYYIHGESTVISEKKLTLQNYYPGSGAGYRTNGVYACAFMDFSGLGTDFHKNELYNNGFASTCSHGCGRHYSVEFVDNSNGDYNLTKTTSNGLAWGEKAGQSLLIQIDISQISDDANGGAQLVAAIVDAAKQSTSFDDHWEQYAYKTSEPAKLYLYEDTLDTSQGERSTWEPAARDEKGEMPLLEYTVGTKKYKEADDLHIQSSALGHQSIIINRPVMTNKDLGIETVNVGDFHSASESMTVVDSAIDYVSSKRAYFGAMQNRLEHALAVNKNTEENTQAGESRLRDTDMSGEMLEFSKQSILAQTGQSVLAQANQTPQGILQLIQ